MLQVCLNGPRTRAEHPALPLTAEELAADAAECVRAGADAIHMHPRDAAGAESLEAAVVDPVVRRVQQASGVPVGVATGAWVEPDPDRRAALVARWTAPDYASVNLSEDGAAQVMRSLLGAGIGIEAGVWSVEDADRLRATGLADRVGRVLVEIVDGPAAEAERKVRAIDEALDSGGIVAPRLYHGEDETAWPVLVGAVAGGRDVRVGLEDTLVDRDGARVEGNASLVAAVAAMRGGA